MNRNLARAVLVVATAATLMGAPPTVSVSASAGDGTAGRTYHVDCADGSDAASGLDRTRAWRTLDRVNQEVFRPADRILVRRGTTCTGVLAPHGSGSAAAPIVVAAYGRGAKPRIVGTGTFAAVHLYNVQGWELHDLNVSNLGATPGAEEGRYGILVQLEDFGIGSYYVIDGVEVHDVNGCDCQDRHTAVPSGGVIIWATGSTVPTGFADVTVRDSAVHDVGSEGIATESDWQHRPEFPRGKGSTYVPITGLTVRGNRVTGTAGDGIGIFATRGALVERNEVSDFSTDSRLYRTGIGVGNADDTVMQLNNVADAQGTLPAQAFAIDHASNRTIVQYNLSRRNNGGALLFCNSVTETAVGNVFRFNISQDDESVGQYPFGSPLAVFNIPCDVAGQLSVYGNTVYTTRATTMIANRLNLPVTFTDNIFAGPATGAVILDQAPSYDHNLYYNLTPPVADQSAVVGDPLFVAPGTATRVADAAGYRLNAGSPALGAGVVVPDSGGRDYFGNCLPPLSWNIGADQGTGRSSSA